MKTHNTGRHSRSRMVRLWTQRVFALIAFIVIYACSYFIGNILPVIGAAPICAWLFFTRSVDWDWTFDTFLSRWAERDEE